MSTSGQHQYTPLPASEAVLPQNQLFYLFSLPSHCLLFFSHSSSLSFLILVTADFFYDRHGVSSVKSLMIISRGRIFKLGDCQPVQRSGLDTVKGMAFSSISSRIVSVKVEHMYGIVNIQISFKKKIGNAIQFPLLVFCISLQISVLLPLESL